MDLERLKGKKLGEVFKFEHNGVRILVDALSANYYAIDEATDAVVESMQSGNFDNLNEFADDQISKAISDLEEAGLILNRDEVKEEKFECPKDANFENMVLHVSHDCNLRCRYCFAETGAYKGERKMMSRETAMDAVDWLVKNSGDKKKLNLAFFGGEPLLNVPLIKDVIAKTKEVFEQTGKTIYMNVCTNGTILNDEILDLIKKNNIGVQVSIDGTKDIHDENRVFPNGSGSYDIVARNVKILLDSLPASQVIPRATVPHGRLRLNDVVQNLFDLGFKTVFFIPALGCGNFVTDESDLDEFKREYAKLAELFIEKQKKGETFNVFPLASEVEILKNGIKRFFGCGSGIGFCSVAVNGDIYPCMRFADKPKYCLGNVSSGDVNKSVRERFLNRSVTNRSNCRKCWCRHFCGGGCVAVAVDKTDDISSFDGMTCEVAKYIVKMAMYINARLDELNIRYKGDPKLFDFMRRRFQ